MIDKKLLASRIRLGAVQIVTIVFSVSVALQFQDCHERNTNERIGRKANVAIEEEIAFNRDNVERSRLLLADIIATMEARRTDAKTMELQTNQSLSLPGLFSGAYDAAVASGAMRHLPSDHATAIARIYKLQNWISLIQERVIMLDIDPVIALAADTQDNRYSQFVLQLSAYHTLERHFGGLVAYYDAFLAGRPPPH